LSTYSALKAKNVANLTHKPPENGQDLSVAVFLAAHLGADEHPEGVEVDDQVIYLNSSNNKRKKSVTHPC